MKRLYAFVVCLLLAVMLAGCSSQEKKVQAFIDEFALSLDGPDSLIVAKFHTNRPEWAIRDAVNILRNKTDRGNVKSKPGFSEAAISFEVDSVRVNIPVLLTDSATATKQRSSFFAMTLVADAQEKYTIVKFDGDSLYQDFFAFSQSLEAENVQQQIAASRGRYYERARELQQNYDSIIWYVPYKEKTYYYTVEGAWDYYKFGQQDAPSYKMGLVDEKGKKILTAIYDLIGTPGMIMDDVVEVRQGNFVGYAQLSSGEEIVPVEYTWIIPYMHDKQFALVRKDSTDGWLDLNYEFHAGFPNAAAEKYVKNFDFLPKKITLKNDIQLFCEIPNAHYAAVGMLVPPSYLTYFGIFDKLEGDFTRELWNEEAGTEYMEAEISFLDKVTESIGAIITRARDSYVYSREGFYDHHKVTFVDARGDSLRTADISGSGELAFRKIDSTLLEVKSTLTEDDISDYGTDGVQELNTPTYLYFKRDAGSLTPLTSARRFPETEFVKLDSSYIKGDFVYYDEKAETTVTRQTLSTATMRLMRNEILAAYGYTFREPADLEQFEYDKTYLPRFDSYAKFVNDMKEIDKHNLMFLEKMTGTLDPEYSASL